MTEEEALYMMMYEATPNPEMENPEGNVGAYITCIVRGESWEQVEQHLLAILPGQGWIPQKEHKRTMKTRSQMSGQGLEYFDHALEHGIYLQIGPWNEPDPDPTETEETKSVEELIEMNLATITSEEIDAVMAEQEKDFAANPRKSIHHAPLLIFIMVCAADGDIDAKEGDKFREILAQSAAHPNPLFREAIVALQSNIQPLLTELIQESLLGWVTFLGRSREAAETLSPQDAPAFCKALYDLGESLAKSSGGVLGFGGISKEEKASLEMIAGILGVK